MLDFDALERKRLVFQKKIDLGQTRDERNRTGQFATSPALANDIVKRALALLDTQAVDFLEPSCGTGAFISSVSANLSAASIPLTVQGIELNPEIYSFAASLWSTDHFEIINGDFLKMDSSTIKPANLLIANPPYVRHHHLPPTEKVQYQDLVESVLGERPSGLSGLYAYFMLNAHRHLKKNAVSAWLIPSEFLDTNYGGIIRRYLAEKVTTIQVHRYDTESTQFTDALVTSSVVLFANALPVHSNQVSFTTGASLESPDKTVKIAQHDLKPSNKWSIFFTDSFVGLPDDTQPRFSDFFDVRRGIATGNNKYFLGSRSFIEGQGIDTRQLHPVLPPPRRLKVDHVTSDKDGWPQLDEQLVLLSSKSSINELEQTNPALADYFQNADGKTRNAYLVRNRTPWYKVETRHPAPFILTYMGRITANAPTFRFIRNDSRAIATNGYLMLYPRSQLKRALDQGTLTLTDVHSFLKSIPDSDLLSAGRVYGGGLRKIEPKELGNVPVTGIHQLLTRRKAS